MSGAHIQTCTEEIQNILLLKPVNNINESSISLYLKISRWLLAIGWFTRAWYNIIWVWNLALLVNVDVPRETDDWTITSRGMDACYIMSTLKPLSDCQYMSMITLGIDNFEHSIVNCFIFICMGFWFTLILLTDNNLRRFLYQYF